MIIDKSKPVMVTGANGYVASWLVKCLLDEGITVHAAVRNPDNKSKVSFLEELADSSSGKIKFFKADLLEPGSYDEAMKGCELVYHTASPFTLEVKDAQKDLIDPAVKGTQNVLDSANKTSSVKRVVLTSSCAAIYTDASECKDIPGEQLKEDVWNSTASLDYQPYSYSKTLAEQKAWEMAGEQTRWDLVTINPSFVMGPPLNPAAATSASFDFLKQLGDGTFKAGAPRVGIGIVDVRDVAEAHFKAGYTPDANGRYITSAHNTNFFEMGQALRPKFGNHFPLPKNTIPKWLLFLVGPMVNKLMTRRYVRNNVDVEFRADNSKIKKELGITFRPLEDSMNEAFQVLVDEGVVKAK